MHSRFRRLSSRLRAGVGLAALLWLGTPVAAGADNGALRVVASLAPIHSLVSQVLGRRGEAVLLLDGGVSPHRYALKPSDARDLAQADLVVWIGPQMENFLLRAMQAGIDERRLLTLSDLPSTVRWPARRGGLWQVGEDQSEEGTHAEHGEAEGGHEGHDHVAHGVDPHFWLDPHNGRSWLAAIRDRLSDLDPAGAATYAANTERALARLRALEATLAQRLAAVSDRPYLVFHDAYQYFERRFGLHPLGSLAVTSGHAPGMRRVLTIRRTLQESGALCLFTEPQFEPRLAARLVEGTAVRLGRLDPLGAGTPTGPGHYAALLERLAGALTDCLAPPG